MWRINELLLELYACPTGQGRWSVVLDQVCRTLGARSAVLQIILPQNGRGRSRWMVRDSRSEAAHVLHDRYFSDAVNPRMLVRSKAYEADQNILRDSDIFEPGDPLLADLEQRLAATGLGQFWSTRAPLPSGEALTLVLHRDINDVKDFTRREERIATELLPHFRQAVCLTGAMLDAQRQAHGFHETVDSLRFALLMCNADGSVHWSNAAAQHILSRRSALWLGHDQQLTTTSASDTNALRKAIARAASADRDDSHDSQLFMLGGDGPEALHVRVRGLDPGRPGDGAADQRGRVLVALSDPNNPTSLPPELLGKLLGLSPAESRLASALCDGSTLNEYATHAGVAISTARYQLKQVMAKTRVHKQSQLVQRLCSSVVFHLRN